MLSRQEDQRERERVLRNDQRVRQQQEQGSRVFAQDQSLRRTSTFHQHALADADTPRGRFSAVENATVIGSKSGVASAYPAGPAWCADPGAQCVEPPLGLDNPALEPSMGLLSSPVEQTGPTLADAPSTPSGQRADVGSLSSQPNPASAVAPLCSEGPAQRGAGLGQSGDFATHEETFPASGPARSRRAVAGSPHPFRRF